MTTNDTHPLPANTPNGSVAGVLIAATTLLSLFIVMHHPVSTASTMAEFIDQVQHQRTLNQAVHGSVIVLLALQYIGFRCLAIRVGWNRLAVQASMVAFGLGVGAMTVAATISGFVVPGFVLDYEAADADVLESVRVGLSICREINRSSDHVGVFALSAAAIGWCAALWSNHRGMAVVAGLVGGVTIAAQLTGLVEATVQGVILFVAGQTVWNLVVAWGLLTRRL